MGKANSLDFDDNSDDSNDDLDNDQNDDNDSDDDLDGDFSDDDNDNDDEDEDGDGDDDDNDGDDSSAIITNLRERIASLEGSRQGQDNLDDDDKNFADEIKPESHDFLKDVSFEDVTSDAGKFNELLNNIYSKAVIDSYSHLSKTMAKIPKSINQSVNNVTKLRKVRDNFYNKNKDLKKFKTAVAATYDSISAANPELSYNEIFKRLGNETRVRLGLKRRKKVPKLHGKSGSSSRNKDKGKNRKSTVQNELDEMNKSLEGE